MNSYCEVPVISQGTGGHAMASEWRMTINRKIKCLFLSKANHLRVLIKLINLYTNKIIKLSVI